MRRVRAARRAKYCGRAPEEITLIAVSDRGREVVNTQKEQFRAAYEAGRQAYHEATTETGAPKNL